MVAAPVAATSVVAGPVLPAAARGADVDARRRRHRRTPPCRWHTRPTRRQGELGGDEGSPACVAPCASPYPCDAPDNHSYGDPSGDGIEATYRDEPIGTHQPSPTPIGHRSRRPAVAHVNQRRLNQRRPRTWRHDHSLSIRPARRPPTAAETREVRRSRSSADIVRSPARLGGSARYGRFSAPTCRYGRAEGTLIL